MSSLSTMLHQSPGILPYFLLYSSFAAVTHSLVTYLRPIQSLKQFSGPAAPPPSALLAHVYGVKNVYTALIRFYAAYHLENKELYDLAIATYVGVLGLYAGEILVWKTVRMREGVIPLVTAASGIVWMAMQRSAYLGHL